MEGLPRSLNVTRTVEGTVQLFELATGMGMDRSALGELLRPGLEAEADLSARYAVRDYKLADMVGGLLIIIEEASVVAMEQGRSTMFLDDLLEAIRRVDCPFKPWC